MIQSPPSFIVRTEAQQAAWDHGYRLQREVAEGWICFGSTTVTGDVWIAATSDHGPWFLSLTHPGVIAEFGAPTAPEMGGRIAWVWASLTELHVALDRAYRLAASLPNAPLASFQAATRNLPRTTETERLIVQRVGQDVFREALMQYWGGCCPITGITEPSLLRASHIVAWSECDDDAHRLDVHNGILLSALWDAAFDRGLVSFADDGRAIVAQSLGGRARLALRLEETWRISALTNAHRANLARHRTRHAFRAG